MATYQIEGDSLKVLGGVKIAMTVTLTAGKRSKKFYHEIESVDPVVINNKLAELALAFEAEDSDVVKSLALNVDEPIEAVVVPIENPAAPNI